MTVCNIARWRALVVRSSRSSRHRADKAWSTIGMMWFTPFCGLPRYY